MISAPGGFVCLEVTLPPSDGERRQVMSIAFFLRPLGHPCTSAASGAEG
jgi:hypothetical protein